MNDKAFAQNKTRMNSKTLTSGEAPSSYKTLTNDELVSKTEKTIQVERESTAEVIRLFEEIQTRKLYLKYGFPSLFEMAVKHFGYCAASAMRRINAMRLIQDVPEAFEKIESGELSLSVVSELQTYFQQEKKAERPYSVNAKIELVEASLGKSRRDVEREIANRNPERVKPETIYAVSNDRMRMNISISKGLLDKINHLRDLRSHSSPNMTIEELLTELVELGLEKHDPDRKEARKAARLEKRFIQERSKKKAKTQPALKTETEELPLKEPQTGEPSSQGSKAKDVDAKAPAERSRLEEQRDNDVGVEKSSAENSSKNSNIANPLPPAEVKLRTRYISVNERPKREPCCYTDPKTGRRCNSTRFLQLDHVTPFAQGGANTKENLRWMCGEHNRARAQHDLH